MADPGLNIPVSKALRPKVELFIRRTKFESGSNKTKLRSSIGRRTFTRTRLNIYHSFVQIFDLLV